MTYPFGGNNPSDYNNRNNNNDPFGYNDSFRHNDPFGYNDPLNSNPSNYNDPFGYNQHPSYGDPLNQAYPDPMYSTHPEQDPYTQYDDYQYPHSRVVAALLAFFLGGLGIHNFYLGHTKNGLFQLLLNVIGWATLVFGIGLIFLLALFVWVMIDFFMIICNSDYRDADGYPLQ